MMALFLGAGVFAFLPEISQAKVVERSASHKNPVEHAVSETKESGVVVMGAGSDGGNSAKIHGGGTMFSVATGGMGVVSGENEIGPPKDVKTVTTTLFDGAELMMVAPQTTSQTESFILTSKSGKLIVVDGGTEEDAPHLKALLKAKGGVVSAWLVTHPHSDHVGALTALLSEADPSLVIENVYYHFAPLSWYLENEAYRTDMVERCMTALSLRAPGSNHGEIKRGDVIQVDDVTVHVLNAPYLLPVNSINNSSVAYRVEMNGKRILFLGDMGVQAGDRLMEEYRGDQGALKADLVQMAHHGQRGVDRSLYELVRPQIALWCCPRWLWENDNGGGLNSGNWKTLEVRNWMRQLDVKTHVVAKDGDQVLR